MRLALLATVVFLVAAPAADAKEGRSVLVVGPRGLTFVEPYRIVEAPLSRLQLRAPPTEGYVLVYPLMNGGVPMRPGRWYPRAGILCSGWRSGVEAGCTTEPQLRGWLGSGVATGVYRREPGHMTTLSRSGTQLLPYGNEATAIKLALNQRSGIGSPPGDCVAFRARWNAATSGPAALCVGRRGGLYARGRVYPMPVATAAFVIG
jgi:hypothetical protein